MVNGPPKNPGTIKANGILIDNYLREYFNTYMPNYGYHITSGYRTPEYNKTIPGAAPDSTHIWNLGRDWVILDSDGNMIEEGLAKKLYDQFFNKWTGYVYFSPSRPEGDPLGKKTYHIHGNLPREWTEKTKWFGGLFVAGAVIFAGLKIWNSEKVQQVVKSFNKD